MSHISNFLQGMKGRPILISCEESGRITDALLDLGYDAWSNDILPTRGKNPERHLQMDAREALKMKPWHGLIAHPVCKAMANSSAKHLYTNKRRFNEDGSENPICPQRWAEMLKGVEFFKLFYESSIPVKAIENSIMLGYAKERIGCGKPDQIVQPHWFGTKETKATCWWVKGLPKLVRTHYLDVPEQGTEERKQWEKCFRMPPGPTRERDRAVTPLLSAKEYARQWGAYLSGEAVAE